MAGCRKCGAGRTVTPISTAEAERLKNSGELVAVEYVGTQEQKQRIRSKVSPRDWYIYGAGQNRFYAYRGDVEWLTSMGALFKLVDTPTIATEIGAVEVPVLSSEAKATPVVAPVADLPVDVLLLDQITLALLKRKYNTINEIRNAGRAEWMTIKGIGAVRADEIEEALHVIQA